MLSDEEKKAIEHMKNYPINWLIENVNESAIKIILNLIEKQSKEIEELKENKGYHLGFIDGGIAKRYEMEYAIKAKIEDILNSENGEAIEKLIEWQSLLGKE